MPLSGRLLLPKYAIIETIPNKLSIALAHNLLTATKPELRLTNNLLVQ